MSYDEFIGAVQDRGGLSSRSEAEATALAVFEALARRILVADRRSVVALLPEALRGAFQDAPAAKDASLDAVVREIAETEHVRAGFGREHLEVVGAAAASTFHPDAVTALRAHLPPDLAAIFQVVPAPPRSARVTPPATPRAGRGHPLSEARSVSRHPIAESKPDRAHAESVAQSDDPHADTKLSSAAGMTQEREHESLADAKE